MKSRKYYVFLIVYMLFLSTIYIFFHPVWLKEFPTLELYNGELSFSGDNAFSKLKELTEKCPGRVIGSRTGMVSAGWVREEFLKLGLEVREEEFQCTALLSGMSGYGDSSSNLKYKTVRGINVIAVSPGESEEVIIIGAHRDVAGEIQGAEDNASGIVSMLELARVLCGQGHHYTYMFVSFDGEECGKWGSKDFVKRYGKLPVKLANILDMTGYCKANTVGFYPYMDDKGAAPLWALVLAGNILSEQGLQPYYPVESTIPATNAWQLFYRVLYSKLLGHINTDSASFTAENIPAVAFMAAFDKRGAGSDETSVRRIHSPADTVAQVSAETLLLTGRFSERYIRSIELNSFSRELSGSYYCITGSRYLGPEFIIFYLVTVFLLFAFLAFMGMNTKAFKSERLLEFICGERFYLILCAALTASIIVFIQIMRIDLLKIIPQAARGVFLLLAAGAGGVYLILYRNRSLRQMGQVFCEVKEMQMAVLNIVYVITAAGLLFLLNPFKAACIMLLPFLFSGRPEYRLSMSGTAWTVLLVIWSAAELLIVKICLQSLLSDLGSLHTALTVFLCGFMWVCTFIYTLYAPAVPDPRRLFLRGAGLIK